MIIGQICIIKAVLCHNGECITKAKNDREDHDYSLGFPLQHMVTKMFSFYCRGIFTFFYQFKTEYQILVDVHFDVKIGST